MIEIRETAEFSAWLGGLRDLHARIKIAARLQRLALGFVGDAKPVGDGVSELRFHSGPGYRVYFVQIGDVLVVLLCGGDKGSQRRDIERAKKMANQLREQGS